MSWGNWGHVLGSHRVVCRGHSLSVPWSPPWVRFQAQTAFHETKSCSQRVSGSDGCRLAELTSAPCCSPLLPASVAGMGPQGKDPGCLKGAWRTDIPRTPTPPRTLTRATLYLDSIRPWNFSPLLGNLVPLNYMVSFSIPAKYIVLSAHPWGNKYKHFRETLLQGQPLM